MLPYPHVRKPFLVNSPAVHQVRTGPHKDRCIACPACSFPCGTISRNVTEVWLHRPYTVFKELVYFIHATFKPRCFLHVRINSNALYLDVRRQNITRYLCISESKHRKMRLKLIPARLADIVYFLFYSAWFVPVSGLEITDREVSVFIQGFTVDEADLLTAFGVFYNKRRITCKVLSEIKYALSARSSDEPSFKHLMLSDKWRLLGCQISFVKRHLPGLMPLTKARTGITSFSQFKVRKLNGPVFTGIPAAIRDKYRILHVSIAYHCAQKWNILAVEVSHAVNSVASSVPAITKRYKYLVFTGL